MPTSLRIRFLFVVLLVFFPAMLAAQYGNVKFKRFGVEDGLSHVTINDIFQDRHGFLWLGTTDGLNRYNGFEFVVFKSIPGDSTSLSDNTINTLYEDHSGKLWVGTFNGLHRYERLHNSFSRIEGPSGAVGQGRVYELIEKGPDQAWVGSSNGLAILNTSTGHEEKVESTVELGSVHRLLQDNEGNLWIGSLSHGLFHYNIKSKELKPLRLGDKVLPVWDLHQDQAGVVWVAVNGAGLFSYDPVNSSMVRFAKPGLTNDRVLSVFEDDQQNLWVGTDKGGLNRLNPARTQVYQYQNAPDNATSLSSNDIRRVFQDKSGLLWFGTWGGGANSLNLSQSDFARYTASGNEANGHELSSNFVQAIFEGPSERIWVGTKNGLNLIGGKNGLVTSPIREKGLALSDPYVKSLFEDREGRLWIGTQNGLNIFDPVKNSLEQIFSSDDPDGLSYDDHLFFFESKAKDLWIGTWKGINKYNQKSQRFENTGIPTALRNKAILSIAEDERGRLWLGTYYYGVYCYEPETGKLDRYDKGSKPDQIANSRVWALHTDKDQNVWIGTFGGGLHRVVENSGRISFERVTEADGLANNAIIAIESDSQGLLWIASNKGISRYNPDTGKVRNYTSDDGLQGDHFNAASFSGNSGRLYFGGSKGLSFFNPLTVRLEAALPEVIIEDFEIFNKAANTKEVQVLEQPVMDTRSITLSHRQRVFSFAFTSSYFNQPQKLVFRYKMEGVDPQWVTTSHKRRYVNYTSVPAGTYSFKVRAINKWGDAGPITEIKIIILPPWWKSWWFLFLMTMAIITTAYLFYRSRIRKVEKQKRKLEKQVTQRTHELKESHDELKRDKELIEEQAQRLRELDRVKSRFFANISHELRTPLTLINAPLETLVHNGEIADPEIRKTLEIARNNGVSLLNLVEEILDLAKLDAGKLKLVENPVRLHEFLTDIINTYSNGFARKAIDFQFQFKMDEHTAVLLDENKAGKIIKNLLSNALKFTPEHGSITLEVRQAGGTHDCIALSVTDTGFGIHPNDLPYVFDRYYQSEQPGKKAEGGTGIGLALAKELALLQKGSLTVVSEQGEGSTFTFEFPAKYDELRVKVAEPESPGESLEGALEETLVHYREKFVKDRPVLLIVEDHQEMRAFIASTLHPYFAIRQASHGKEALEQLRINEIDIMISDVMMPEMDGFELLEQVKNDESLIDMSIIMLTARAEQEDKLFALTMGIDDYLTKPFSSVELLARIKNILDNRIRILHHLKQVRGASEPVQDQELLEAYGLSERELDVMRLMANRATNAEMAEALHISSNTVKYHIKNIYLKLDVSSKSEASKKAAELFS